MIFRDDQVGDRNNFNYLVRVVNNRIESSSRKITLEEIGKARRDFKIFVGVKAVKRAV